ncbi:hypothetical protein T4B_8054 [Trichinella pseudospiralis]|uniref:Uncharacterized protein n=1 Tax=Trichinella pseudospiralis TaxID=6337 RepID=A0A0V1IYB1_TRIPS|nr:hypothetical protein T4B_8054 [Trichinella pseudospiralis]
MSPKYLISARILSWAWREWLKSASDERFKPYITRNGRKHERLLRSSPDDSSSRRQTPWKPGNHSCKT